MTHVYSDEERRLLDRRERRELARLRHHPHGRTGPHCHGHIWEACQRWRLRYLGALVLMVAAAWVPYFIRCT